MNLTTTQQADVTIIAVSGDLTTDSAVRFRESITKSLNQGQRDFVIDLKQLSTVDSIGLEALTATQRECDEQLGMVRFCGADAGIRKVFELTRLDRTFELHDGLDEALASFK